MHGFVVDAFGFGIVVPLMKDKTGDANSLNNYRGITIIPVISKLFEILLLEYFENVLLTDDLQFGFKKGLGCSNAIFTLSETTEYFRNRGSTIYAAALDISKAFDCVNNYKLFTSLIKAGLPKWVIAILINWYSKLQVSVRRKITTSFKCNVGSDVRQGSSFSPAMFTVFVNLFIINLRVVSMSK